MLRTIVNSASLPTVDASSSDPAADLKPLLVTASQLKQWQDCVTGKQLTPPPLTTVYHPCTILGFTHTHTSRLSSSSVLVDALIKDKSVLELITVQKNGKGLEVQRQLVPHLHNLSYLYSYTHLDFFLLFRE